MTRRTARSEADQPDTRAYLQRVMNRCWRPAEPLTRAQVWDVLDSPTLERWAPVAPVTITTPDIETPPGSSALPGGVSRARRARTSRPHRSTARPLAGF